MMRSVLTCVICLVLVATSHAAAMARTAERPVGQMVICTGAQAVVVPVGADGQPTAMPHLCPDCALHILGAHAAPVVSIAQALGQMHFAPLRAPLRPLLRCMGGGLARAPPVPV